MPSVEFKCKHCCKTFCSNSSLRRRGRQQHNRLELPECQRRGRKCSSAIACDVCQLTFNSRRVFHIHTRRKHNKRRCHVQRSAVNKFVFENENGKFGFMLLTCTCVGLNISAERLIIGSDRRSDAYAIF